MPLDYPTPTPRPLNLGERRMVVDSPLKTLSVDAMSTCFDRFTELMATDGHFRSVCNDVMDGLNEDSDVREHYGGFFKNKFKNSEGVLGFDEKVYWQFSTECLDHMELCLSISGYRGDPAFDAVLLAQETLRQGIDLLMPSIKNLCLYYPELSSCLLSGGRELSVAARFMRYLPNHAMATNPHVDKTVLSSIIWNSDFNQSQRLAFPPTPAENGDVTKYTPICCRTEEQARPAYIFWGAALSEAGYAQPASPHAVLPIDGCEYRYSIAVFWLLPGLDMSKFSTAIPSKPKCHMNFLAA